MRCEVGTAQCSFTLQIVRINVVAERVRCKKNENSCERVGTMRGDEESGDAKPPVLKKLIHTTGLQVAEHCGDKNLPRLEVVFQVAVRLISRLAAASKEFLSRTSRKRG